MALAIKSIELRDGSKFNSSPIIVVVGPNNCGKTRLLREMVNFLKGDENFDFKILKAITSENGDFDSIVKGLGINRSSAIDGSTESFHLDDGYFGTINLSGAKDYFETIRKDVGNLGPLETLHFRKQFGVACFAMIETEDRLIASKSAIVKDDRTGLLDTIYMGGSELEKVVSDHTFDVFGLHIKLDFSDPGKLSIRVGDDFLSLPLDPRDAYRNLREYPRLEDQGDGFRSFTTSLCMLKVTNRPMILIDEPEAFLHPPQAAALGRIIGETAKGPGSIVLATHSSDLLRGIMSARSDVTIVRLSRKASGTNGHILDTSEIKTIIETPLLNSTRVLDSLFYQGVVIMEGDSDRAFYEKIARTYFDGEVHYLHAHNKQTVYQLIKPYVNASVNFAAILDFDILRDREDLKKIVTATSKTQGLNRALGLQKIIQDFVNGQHAIDIYRNFVSGVSDLIVRDSQLENIDSIKNMDLEAEKRTFDFKSATKKLIDESDKWAIVKRVGRNGLSASAQVAFDELDSICKAIGIFIVPCGSLESWLAYHGFPSRKNKAKWISGALVWLDQNMPEDMPVKTFIGEIHRRILNSA